MAEAEQSTTARVISVVRSISCRAWPGCVVTPCAQHSLCLFMGKCSLLHSQKCISAAVSTKQNSTYPGCCLWELPGVKKMEVFPPSPSPLFRKGNMVLIFWFFMNLHEAVVLSGLSRLDE